MVFAFEGNFQLLEGQFNGGFFALRVWGAYYLEGLIYGGAYFRSFMVTFVLIVVTFFSRFYDLFFCVKEIFFCKHGALTLS